MTKPAVVRIERLGRVKMDSPSRPFLPRRAFLRLTGAATATLATAGLPIYSADAPASAEAKVFWPPIKGINLDHSQLLFRLHEADGSALEPERFQTLYVRDLQNDTLPRPVRMESRGARLLTAHISLGKEPVQLAVQLKVPGFGEVFCFADNEGQGYTRPYRAEFVVEAAATRLRRVREAAELAKAIGLPRDPTFEAHLEGAARPVPSNRAAEQITVAYQALADGLHAGERLTLNLARHRISKFAKPRSDFLFGCSIAGWKRGPEFEQRFRSLFNFGVTGWYSWSGNPEPLDQRIDYSVPDQGVDWCLARNIIPKSYGYVYPINVATPSWFRQWPYDKVLAEYKRIVAGTMRRYAGRVPYIELVNEAHDKANVFDFSHEQILELTREACRAAREASPTTKLLINHCCLLAEYARRPNADGGRRWSPYRYLRDCVSAGVDFDLVGLQSYYPRQDLFEIERMFDRFKDFKRPIHITELGCGSAEGADPASLRPNSVVADWHGPWTESVQADWLEAMYTICYSKPEFQAVGWWDLADVGGHFWPHGGLLRKDYSPKEAYFRLQNLQRQWGVGGPA